jgi:membrane protein implicated in regulation of membrane protease activity
MDIFKDDKQYLEGTENWFIRAYFYCSNGLIILNEFRNLFLGILGLYIALKWDNIGLAIGLFVISVIILTIAGYYKVHKVGKVTEFLNIRFSSHFGKKTYDFTEDNNKLLREIRDLLNENKP